MISDDTNSNEEFIKALEEQQTPAGTEYKVSSEAAPALVPEHGLPPTLTWKQRQKMGRKSTRYARRMPDEVGKTFQDQQGQGYVRCADGSVRRTKS